MKHNIVKQAEQRLKLVGQTTTGHANTKEIRTISSELFKQVEDKSLDNVLSICEELLAFGTWSATIIAFDFAFRVKKQYKESTFTTFEGWLKKYCTDWGPVDDFCSHAFGELIIQNTNLIHKILRWTQMEEWWMRRAAAVIFLPSIRKNKYQNIDLFHIADTLMHDEHYLVQKGYGWMLKELSQKEPDLVFDYLLKHRTAMPRTAFRYALEKLDPESKKNLMKKV